MRHYLTPIGRRMYVSAWRKQRRRSDPAFRLACINEQRRRKGLPLLDSADDLPPVGQRRRDARGVFV